MHSSAAAPERRQRHFARLEVRQSLTEALSCPLGLRLRVRPSAPRRVRFGRAVRGRRRRTGSGRSACARHKGSDGGRGKKWPHVGRDQRERTVAWSAETARASNWHGCGARFERADVAHGCGRASETVAPIQGLRRCEWGRSRRLESRQDEGRLGRASVPTGLTAGGELGGGVFSVGVGGKKLSLETSTKP